MSLGDLSDDTLIERYETVRSVPRHPDSGPLAVEIGQRCRASVFGWIRSGNIAYTWDACDGSIVRREFTPARKPRVESHPAMGRTADLAAEQHAARRRSQVREDEER